MEQYYDRTASPEPTVSSSDPVAGGTTPPAPEAPREVPDFVVDTQVDRAATQAIVNALGPRYYIVGYPVCGALCLVLGLVAFLLFDDFLMKIMAVALWVVGVTFFITRFLMTKRILNKQMARHRENFGTDVIPQQLVFWPQGLVLHNLLSGGTLPIRYNIIKKVIRHKNYLFLQTQEDQPVCVHVDSLADKPDFLPYLLAKCPQAKKKGL